LVLTLVGAAAPSAAQSPFRLEKTRDVVLLSSGLAAGVGSLLLLDTVDPLTTEQIADLDPDDVNDFDRDSIGPYRKVHAGDALAYLSYALPFSIFLRDDSRRDWQVIAVMWTEATMLNLGINGVVKSTVLRTRPYAYDPETSMERKTEESARLSFYSGHTASAACNSFFTARVLSEYVTGSTAKRIMWAGAAVYPALTGFLRVDSAHHFRTDIIFGYVIGGAIGYFIPQLHATGDERVSVNAVVIDGDPGVGVSVVF
jgi:membrane-associated phospholipid phosphatase